MMESNTFSPVKADVEHFKTGYLLFGNEVINSYRDKSTEIGEFIEAAKLAKVKLFSSISAWSVSSGESKHKLSNF